MLAGITGPVQLACQLLNKHDEVIFIGEEVVDNSNNRFHSPRRGKGEEIPVMDSSFLKLQDRGLELWSKVESFEVDEWVQPSSLSPNQNETTIAPESPHPNSCALTTTAAASPALVGTELSPDEHSKDTANDIESEHIKANMMADASKLMAELRLVVAERDSFRQNVQRQLMLDAQKNRKLEFLQSRVQALELQMAHHLSHKHAASRELAHQTALCHSVVSELENARDLLADRIRVSANLEEQLRECRAQLEDPDFGGKDWREPLSQRDASIIHTRHSHEKVLRTPSRNSKSPALKSERGGGAVIGASSVKLTEDMFNMRPRLVKVCSSFLAFYPSIFSSLSGKRMLRTGEIDTETCETQKHVSSSCTPPMSTHMHVLDLWVNVDIRIT
jgi:hypothetical protein